jgi:hypothetical protein
LNASTNYPLEYLGALEDAGTFNVGKRANLALLEANSLENNTITRKIMRLCEERNGWIEMIYRIEEWAPNHLKYSNFAIFTNWTRTNDPRL